VWVVNTRTRHFELDYDRIARLDSIGFVWDARDRQWESMFAKLKDYYRKHGDCLVPISLQRGSFTWFLGYDTAAHPKSLIPNELLDWSLSFFESFGPTMGKYVCQA
jgi:hypothetical protein